MSGHVSSTNPITGQPEQTLSAGSAQQPRPPAAGSFARQLDQAFNSYSRRQQQTEFLRSADELGEVMPGVPVDESQRRLVLRNAVAGYGFDPAAPAPIVPPSPTAPSERSRPSRAIESLGLDPSLLTPLSIDEFPRPAGDNGRGVHWIPTLSSDARTIDRFVQSAADMGMKWVVFLNEGTNVADNDYLVKRLTDKGIMPVMRIFTDGIEPIQGDLEGLVRHYHQLGVSYFQLYNEPNLMVETHGEPPDVSKYLDLWIPAAKRVIAAGGLPGIGALSPQGEMDDRKFLASALDELQARGEGDILQRTWLAVHNYTGPRPVSDPDGFLRFRQYDAIIRQRLGHSLPMVGTEGGTHVGPGVDESRQVQTVLDSYRYMEQSPEPYNFSYTYWIIANEAGGGKDPAFTQHALIREDGPSALARALTASA